MTAPVVFVEIDGLGGAAGLEDITPEIEAILAQALNKTATRSRTMFDRTIRDEIAFPASYLRPSAKRLWVKKKAGKNSMEAIIEGRGRATSLARFTKQKPLANGKRRRGGDINVTVKPGQSRKVKRAFLVNLKNGNTGLAVRTDGSKPSNAYKPAKLGKNAWLLYGPSVDQALVSATTGGGIVTQLTGKAVDLLNDEFDRLLRLKGFI